MPISGTLSGLRYLQWNLCAVTRGAVWEATFDAIVLDVPEVQPGWIVGNLGKASGFNTVGAAYSLRDMAQVQYAAPEVWLFKENQPGIDLTAGQAVTYTIVVSNNPFSDGPSTAYNLVVTDVVPAGVIVPATGGVGAPAAATYSVLSGSPQTGAGGTLIWTSVPALSAGGLQVYTYTAVVAPSLIAGTVLTNIASVGANSQPDDSGRPITRTSDLLAPNTDDASITLAQPEIFKAAAPGPVTIGSVVTFTLDVTIPAGLILPGVILTDVLNRDGLRYNDGAFVQDISGTPLVPASIQSATVLTGTPGPGLTLAWDLGNVNNSLLLTPYAFRLVFTATVTGLSDDGAAWNFFPPGANDSADNTAALGWNSLAGPQSTGSNTTTTNIDQPLLRLSKSVAPNQGLRGGDVASYTLVVTNVGYSAAYDIVLTDTLPPGLAVRRAG
jgi:uncharacterized repeat protein (TIGR01451 family)